MTAFRILFVCIGNVCRSPLGERLLASKLPADAFEVSSAGVGAMTGSPMTPESVVHLEAYGGSATGFVARQLTPATVKQSDLVLAATTEIRTRILEDAPSALRRTFTVLEFASLLDVVPEDTDPAVLVRNAALERSRAAPEDYDIPDPYGRGEEAYAVASTSMAVAVERVAQALGA